MSVDILDSNNNKVILQSSVELTTAGDADLVNYDNSVSGLAATNVQAGIDEIVNLSGGVATWGSIAGTLSDQTDLQNALDAKASTSSLSTVATTGNSDDLTEGTSQLLMTAMERSKLSSIATGATQNATDAFLLDRGNHTGTQPTSTISGLSSAIDGQIAAAVLGDLSNVDTSGLVSGQIMEFDGSNFVAIPTPSGGSGGAVDSVNGQTGTVVLNLGDLSNVDTSGLTAGQVIEYDGTNFVAIDTPSGGSGAVDSVNGQTGTVTLNADDISDGTTTNKYTTQAEIDKLAAIEASATADQTAGEIKTAYESNLDTNAFTNNEQSKLTGIEASANNYAHPNHTGDVTSTGDGATTIANDAVTNAKLDNMAADTVKGRASTTGDPQDLTAIDVRTLINVEDGATADQSDAEIKTAYENNTDTNAFTNTEQSKLSGVETGATANSTDATLLDRANHTGSQVASTISDFDSAADARIAASDKVSSNDPNNVTTSSALTNMISLTQTEFDAIATPDATTVYFIEE